MTKSLCWVGLVPILLLLRESSIPTLLIPGPSGRDPLVSLPLPAHVPVPSLLPSQGLSFSFHSISPISIYNSSGPCYLLNSIPHPTLALSDLSKMDIRSGYFLKTLHLPTEILVPPQSLARKPLSLRSVPQFYQ